MTIVERLNKRTRKAIQPSLLCHSIRDNSRKVIGGVTDAVICNANTNVIISIVIIGGEVPNW